MANRKNESILGAVKLHLPTVDSTNNYAANMIKERLLDHGTVILADEQTNGRGQRGSVWQSESGKNLQFSLVIFPDELSVSYQRYLNSFVSLSLISFLRNLGIEAKIKWPNDIFVGSKKIAGILIENQLKRDNIHSAILGIGLNVNQTEFGDLNATSLALETNSNHLSSETLDSLLYQLNKYYSELQFGRFAALETAYYQNLLGYQEFRKFKDKQGDFEGKIQGVSKDGLLLIHVENEPIRQYDIKELTYIF